MRIKTIVPKQGDLESYINKPFLDRIDGDIFKSKVIGVITDAVEIETGYELTINIFGEFKYEFFEDGQLIAMSTKLRTKV
jgi:hypothetical protein